MHGMQRSSSRLRPTWQAQLCQRQTTSAHRQQYKTFQPLRLEQTTARQLSTRYQMKRLIYTRVPVMRETISRRTNLVIQLCRFIPIDSIYSIQHGCFFSKSS